MAASSFHRAIRKPAGAESLRATPGFQPQPCARFDAVSSPYRQNHDTQTVRPSASVAKPRTEALGHRCHIAEPIGEDDVDRAPRQQGVSIGKARQLERDQRQAPLRSSIACVRPRGSPARVIGDDRIITPNAQSGLGFRARLGLLRLRRRAPHRIDAESRPLNEQHTAPQPRCAPLEYRWKTERRKSGPDETPRHWRCRLRG